MFKVLIQTDETEVIFVGDEKDCKAVMTVLEQYHSYDKCDIILKEVIEPRYKTVLSFLEPWEYRYSYEQIVEKGLVGQVSGLKPLSFEAYQNLGGDLKYTAERYADYLKTYNQAVPNPA